MAGTILFDNPKHPNHPAYKAAHEATAKLMRMESAAKEKIALDSGVLKKDGPTIAEFVKAGYDPKTYPPGGFESRSTAEEVKKAIAEYKPKDK